MRNSNDVVGLASQRAKVIMGSSFGSRMVKELANGQDPLAVLVLLFLSAADGWYDRQEAIEALGQLKGDLALIAIRSALLDTDEAVRGTAAQVLGRVGNRSDIGRLIHAAQDVDYEVRRSAALSLGYLGGPRVRRTLMAMYFTEKNKFVLRDIVRGLGELHSKAVTPFLEAVLCDKPHLIVRAEILYQLYVTGDHSKIEELLDMLPKSNVLLRRNIANAIEPSSVRLEDLAVIELRMQMQLASEDPEDGDGVAGDIKTLLELIRDERATRLSSLGLNSSGESDPVRAPSP